LYIHFYAIKSRSSAILSQNLLTLPPLLKVSNYFDFLPVLVSFAKGGHNAPFYLDLQLSLLFNKKKKSSKQDTADLELPSSSTSSHWWWTGASTPVIYSTHPTARMCWRPDKKARKPTSIQLALNC